MSPQLFNFLSLLQEIHNNDWAKHPHISIMGPQRAGKSKFLSHLCRAFAAQGDAAVYLEADHFITEDLIARAACRADVHGVFSETRTLLLSSASQVVISASTFHGSVTHITTSPMHNERVDRQLRTLLPALSGDLLRSVSPVFFFIDDQDQASDAVATLTADLEFNMASGGCVRLVTTRTDENVGFARAAMRQSNGMVAPRILAIHPLDEAQIIEWGEQIGLTLNPGEAETIRSGTGGWAGEAYPFIMRLWVDRSRSASMPGGLP